MNDQPVDAEQYDPEHARSERAPRTPPQPDAERMEAALRLGAGDLEDDHEEADRERAARQRPTEPGPGTSLT